MTKKKKNVAYFLTLNARTSLCRGCAAGLVVFVCELMLMLFCGKMCMGSFGITGFSRTSPPLPAAVPPPAPPAAPVVPAAAAAACEGVAYEECDSDDGDSALSFPPLLRYTPLAAASRNGGGDTATESFLCVGARWSAGVKESLRSGQLSFSSFVGRGTDCKGGEMVCGYANGMCHNR